MSEKCRVTGGEHAWCPCTGTYCKCGKTICAMCGKEQGSE